MMGEPLDKEHTMTEHSAKPVHEIRLGGVRAAIWENDASGVARHNVTFSRSYQRDEEWRNTQTFGRDDLPRLMKCADLAYEWIFNQGRQTSTRSADETTPVEGQA
jgi:hypothetical protein